MEVSALYIYPIKSLAGISMKSAEVTERGLSLDRRWMLVDHENQFISLRECPGMSLLQPMIAQDHLKIRSLKAPGNDLTVPFDPGTNESAQVVIWNATCQALQYSAEINQWFSEMLEIACKLVWMPDSSWRPVDTTSGFKPVGKFTSFSDAYPFLLISEASLTDLNQRLSEPVSMLRFRPNIVVNESKPYQEDGLEQFSINGISFTGLENCARCQVPNVDPATGVVSKTKEPIKTLSGYRRHNGNVIFGRNLVHSGTGPINVGDVIVEHQQ